jgi:hypothetical protein
LTYKEVAERTGVPETKVQRLAKVVGHPRLWGPIKEGVLPLNQATKLLEACKGNNDKLQAFENTFAEEFEVASKKAKDWQDRLKKTDKTFDPKAIAKSKIRNYFKSYDWDKWQVALESEDGIDRDAEGKYWLKLDAATPSTKKKGVWIGATDDWKTDFAVYGFFSHKVENIATEDIKGILDNFASIGENIRMHYEQRLRVEAAAAYPMATMNPITTPNTPAEPIRQNPAMQIGSVDDDTQ